MGSNPNFLFKSFLLYYSISAVQAVGFRAYWRMHSIHNITMKNITSSKHSARFVTVSERCQSFMCKCELGWSNNGRRKKKKFLRWFLVTLVHFRCNIWIPLGRFCVKKQDFHCFWSPYNCDIEFKMHRFFHPCGNY